MGCCPAQIFTQSFLFFATGAGLGLKTFFFSYYQHVFLREQESTSRICEIAEIIRRKPLTAQFTAKCQSLELSIDLNKQETPRNTRMTEISEDNRHSATMETLSNAQFNTLTVQKKYFRNLF